MQKWQRLADHTVISPCPIDKLELEGMDVKSHNMYQEQAWHVLVYTKRFCRFALLIVMFRPQKIVWIFFFFVYFAALEAAGETCVRLGSCLVPLPRTILRLDQWRKGSRNCKTPAQHAESHGTPRGAVRLGQFTDVSGITSNSHNFVAAI